VVTGTVPDGVDLMYRVGSKNISGPGQINGNATRLPWESSAPFNPATKFYFLSAQLYGSGSVSCKIVVELPGGTSMTVAAGQASGKFSTCSVEAKPDDPSGSHWHQV